jgi:hypothetical protein
MFIHGTMSASDQVFFKPETCEVQICITNLELTLFVTTKYFIDVLDN